MTSNTRKNTEEMDKKSQVREEPSRTSPTSGKNGQTKKQPESSNSKKMR